MHAPWYVHFYTKTRTSHEFQNSGRASPGHGGVVTPPRPFNPVFLHPCVAKLGFSIAVRWIAVRWIQASVPPPWWIRHVLVVSPFGGKNIFVDLNMFWGKDIFRAVKLRAILV